MNQEPQPWQRLGRTDLFTHPRMRLVEDTVLLPDGTETNYLLQPPVAAHSVGIIVLDGTKILLQREYSYPPQLVMWQLPGGGTKPGETPETAAVRELREEAGLLAADCTVIGSFYTNNRRSDERQYVVVCRRLTKIAADADPEEFIWNRWIERSQLGALVTAGEIVNINLLAALSLFEHNKMADM